MTGSTRGIGLETARQLVAEGARVVTCGRGAAPAIGEALHVTTDLSEPAAPAALIERGGRGAWRSRRPRQQRRRGRARELRGSDRRGVGGALAAQRDELCARDPGRGAASASSAAARSSTSPRVRASGRRSACRTTPSRRLPCSRSRGSSPTRTPGEGVRSNAVTPGPTATDAWLGEGGLADQQGGDRNEVLAKVGRRPATRPARRARGDRGRHLLPRLRAGVVRHRRRVVGRRRHRADHRLARRLRLR